MTGPRRPLPAPTRRAGMAVGALALAAATASACGNTDAGTAAAAPPSVSPTPPAASVARARAHSGVASSFRTRPDLHPSRIIVDQHDGGTAAGYVFAAPRPAGGARGGPMMFDDAGHVIWFKQLPSRLQAVDFKLQRYRGRPVLTWGQRPVDGHGGAIHVIADRHYRTIATVHATAGITTDLHDFKLVPHGRALVLGYRMVHRDLRPWGGPANGLVQEAIIQIIDVRTGRARFTWHSLAHIGIGESYRRPAGHASFDYLHANSLALTGDGNILMSARHTSAVYEISRRTGRILWRLGGKRSSFRMGPGTRFAYQHDAEPGPHGSVTVFDNASIAHGSKKRSSAMRIALDKRHHRARLVHAYKRPHPLLATSQGNYQLLPDGHAFVGWGSQPYLSEFAPGGKLLFDARFPTTAQQSYRAFRFAWNGSPRTRPAVEAARHGRDRTVVYASWNGATAVRTWEVLAGSGPKRLKAVGAGPWKGFETALTVRSTAPYVAVRAVGAGGRVLRTSIAVRPAR